MEAVPATSQCRYSRGGGRLAYNPGRTGQAHLRSPPQPAQTANTATQPAGPPLPSGPGGLVEGTAPPPAHTWPPSPPSGPPRLPPSRPGQKAPAAASASASTQECRTTYSRFNRWSNWGGEAVFAGRGVLKAGRQAHFQLREGALAHAFLPLLGYQRGCTSTLHRACSDVMAVALGTARRCRIRACSRRVAWGRVPEELLRSGKITGVGEELWKAFVSPDRQSSMDYASWSQPLRRPGVNV